MDGLLAIATALFLAASAAGLGAVILKALGLRERLPALESWPVSVIIGVGALGWLMFFPAVARALTPPALFSLAVGGRPGCFMPCRDVSSRRPGRWHWRFFSWRHRRSCIAVLPVTSR